MDKREADAELSSKNLFGKFDGDDITLGLHVNFIPVANMMQEQDEDIEERQHQMEQREEGEAVSADSLALVQRYNDIIASLTEAFFQVGMRGKIIKAFLLTRVNEEQDQQSFSPHKSYQIAGGYCDHQSRKGGWDYF